MEARWSTKDGNNGIQTPGAHSPGQSNWQLDGEGNMKQVDGVNRQFSSLNAQTQIGTAVHSFDTQGNETGDGTYQFTWDFENRMHTVTTAGNQLIATYDYDADGRRNRQVITNSGNLNGETDFLLDGNQEIEEHNSTDSMLRQYVFGDGINEPLMLDVPGNPHLYYHQDLLSSVYALTDQSGGIKEGYLYDAYGKQTVFTPGSSGYVTFGSGDNIAPNGISAVQNPYLFTGMRFDPETATDNLYYDRARYYSTTEARFISTDPMGYAAGDSNLYGYTGEGPTNATDPSGLDGKGVVQTFFDWVFGEPQGLMVGDPFAQIHGHAMMPEIVAPAMPPRLAALGPVAGILREEGIMSRVDGAGRVASGTGGALFSLALTETGVGTAVAVPLAGWSGDQLGTGFDEIFSGRLRNSLGGEAIKTIAGDGFAGDAGAFVYDVGPNFVGPYAASRLRSTAIERAMENAGGRFSVPATTARNSLALPEGYIGAERQLPYRGPILGGSYRDVRAANVGGDVHHMPANSASPLSREIGPGIHMPTLDHARTASFAGNPGSRQYIARQRELIGQGRFNEAVQMDIMDVQGLFGNKYEEHFRQFFDWLRLSRTTPGN